METFKIRDEYIKLGQAMKATGMVSTGVEAKIVIQNGEVKVNGIVETRRGKKLVAGDEILYQGMQVKIC